MTEFALDDGSQSPAAAGAFRSLERLRGLARLLDSAVRVPGTQIRFGLDPLIGLVPGIGDAIGALLSMVIVYHAARLGASRAMLIRMLGNVGIDTLVGEIPLLGDLFDFGWKSNTRNLALLEEHLRQPRAARAGSRRVLLLVGGGFLLLLAGVVALGVLLGHFLLELVK
jgi:Domain of unknown function (DUF4112)